jgi:hypothetical protein
MRRLLIAAVLLGSALTALAKTAVPFIENDFARAVASGKARNKPIFVEAWAPW